MNENVLNCLKDYCIEIVERIKEAYGENEKYKDLLKEGYSFANDLASLPVFANISFSGYMQLFEDATTFLLGNFLFHKARVFGII